MAANYTAVVQQSGEWWIGWTEEVPTSTRKDTHVKSFLTILQNALEEALEMNRADARAAANSIYGEMSIPA